jgi:hypothetical protein
VAEVRRRVCAAPHPTATKATHTPPILRKLQEAAEDDDDVAELLKDTGGDPRAVEARVRSGREWRLAASDN